MSGAQGKHVVGDAVAHLTPAHSARKPCGCGALTDSSSARKLTSRPPYHHPAQAPGLIPPPQNEQTSILPIISGVGIPETMKTRVPRYATSLARDTLRLMQTFCMAAAIILYYLIFSYVQLVYVIVASVFYFHNADGPMKLTLTVVMATALLILYHLFYKLANIFGV